MGRPLANARGELGGVRERAEAMMALAPEALTPEVLPAKPGFAQRRIDRLPVGVVLCLAPWNYPLLTAVNCVVPSVLAGNAVMLKHSPRTPLCGDAFERAFEAAGAPPGLVQVHGSVGGGAQTTRVAVCGLSVWRGSLFAVCCARSVSYTHLTLPTIYSV